MIQLIKISALVMGSAVVSMAGNYEKAVVEYNEGKIKSASELFKTSCDAGRKDACLKLGFLYVAEKSLKKSGSDALFLLDRACADGIAKACYVAGDIVKNGRGIKRDEGMANRYIKDGACKAGDLNACNNLGVAIIKGDGGYQVDIKRAMANFKSTCGSKNGNGCYNMGATLLKEGDKESATKYFGQACKLGVEKACGIKI